MAAGGLSRTIEGGHEEFYDFPCSLCQDEGKHLEAARYCKDCFVYMCVNCTRHHNKFPLNKTHQLLDQSQFATVTQFKPVSFPTKRCLKHPGELLSIYCGDHDVVCCSSCKALEHSNCAETEHLIDAAKGIQNSKEYQTIKQETRALLNDAVRVLADRKADISRIENERKDVKKIIADFRKKVNKYFDDLEQKTLDALHDKAEVIVSSCKQDTKDLTVMKSTAEDMLKQLESFKGDNECDLFVQVKADKKFLRNAMQEVLNISKNVRKDAINFRIDQKIEPYLSSLEGLGTFTEIPVNVGQLSLATTDRHVSQSRASTSSSQTSPDNRAPLPIYKTQLYGKFDVNEKSDSEECHITDICQLPDGTILIVDYNNDKLKRLDQSYKLLDSLRLPGSPYSICNVGSDEVAVSLCDAKKVQYISVKKKLTLTRSFSTGNYCRGMVYVDDKLYVCCGDSRDSASYCIEVYNNAGQLHHSISGLSSLPLYITVTDDGQHLLVTSYPSDNITMMDLTGNVVNTFSNRDLKQPSGICTDGKGQVFICGISSNTVVQLEPKQQKIDVILGMKDGIDNPCAIYYDRKQSSVLVSCFKSNQLLVFSLK
ncbi:E3 ubiquitin-protein ligase TRIM71-like [Mercenaria mercenaria]|uniref:E3 ubiquitin-protein ligase TRIM71-like n=1 Tax=Mercenaria mercenaria TaxID=6596 RepID=UPI00234F3E08|nr:E3 ubiquitin-protein ligase TRIM71-like [Mercenaria mercenaria]